MTDTTAPRTAAPDLTELRRLAETVIAGPEIPIPASGWYAEEDDDGWWSVLAKGDGKTTAEHNVFTWGPLEATHRYIAALDPATVLDLLDRAEAIAPLLALVRAADVLAECIGIDDYYETVSWPVDADGNSSSDEADRAAHVFAERLAALPESVRVAARKPE